MNNSSLIVKKLIEKNILDEANKDIYEYGSFIIFNYFVLYLTAYIVCRVYLLNYDLLYFLSIILLFRSYTGGFHFKNYYYCLFTSIMELFFIAFLLKNLNLNTNILLVLIIIFSIFIFLFAPVDTKNRRLDVNERRKIKKKVLIILTCGLLLSFLFFIMCYEELLLVYFLSLSHCLILLIFGIIDNKIRMWFFENSYLRWQ